jgi:hypothetical protein
MWIQRGLLGLVALAGGCSRCGRDEAPMTVERVGPLAREFEQDDDGFAYAKLDHPTLPGRAEADPSTTGAPTLEAFRARGRIHEFDVETGTFPNRHDTLLRELADYAGDALEDVQFSQQLPRGAKPDEGIDGVGPYVLRARTARHVLEVAAANHDDWYDVEAVLGLLNTLLRLQQSSLRYVLAAADGQTAYVLCAPRAQLVRARAAGTLQFLDPNLPMRNGRGAEETFRNEAR